MHRALSCVRFCEALVSINQPSTLSNTLINYESRRFGRSCHKWYHWPNDFLPFHWERPQPEPSNLRTGDVVRDIGYWNSDELIPGAEHSKELQNAPESVRKLFSLGMAKRKDVVQFQKLKAVSQARRHLLDTCSPEVKIAEYTIKIRDNLYHFTKVNKDDVPKKIRQNIMVQKRQRLLKGLYWEDRDRYDYIVKLFGIDNKVPKLGEVPIKPTRKGELRRLTQEYCDRIKQQRLDQYHEELKAKQATLQQELEEIDQMIKEEEKYLGIHNPTPSI